MACKIGFIGTGNMGGALMKAIAQKDTRKEYELFGFDINRTLVSIMSSEIGFTALDSASSLVSLCDIIFLAVKPQYALSVLQEIRDSFSSEKLLVSIIVGLPIAFYKKELGEDAKIIRTMPNTPAMIGEGMTLVCCDPKVTDMEKNRIINLLRYSGLAEELEERLMNEVTALTGSSPAYVFMMIEAMADAAVQSGIPRNLAYRLAAQAVQGSANMVLSTGKHPGELKDMVCSPAGTTIEAVAALEREGFRSAIITAMGECTEKARAIGNKFSS